MLLSLALQLKLCHSHKRLQGGRAVTVKEALERAVERLRAAGVSEPQVDAEWLLAHLLRVGRTNLRADNQRLLTTDQWNAYEALVAQRAQRIPLAYLLGEQPFCGLSLKVDPRVMIPRPETEQLVSLVVQKLKALGQRSLMLADIGTGSGAIALALAQQLEAATVYGVDLSPDALAVAEENARRLGLDKRCVFLLGDLTEPLEVIFPTHTFDAVVANLPYVADEEWEELEPEVREHEPPIALRGGRGGLEVLQRFADCPLHRLLTPEGFIALEVGANQGKLVQNLWWQKHWRRVTIERDLAGIERFVFVQR